MDFFPSSSLDAFASSTRKIKKRSRSPRRGTPSPLNSAIRKLTELKTLLRKKSPKTKRRSPSPKRRKSPKRRSPSPKRHKSPKRRKSPKRKSPKRKSGTKSFSPYPWF
jgi:hypothetical protein